MTDRRKGKAQSEAAEKPAAPRRRPRRKPATPKVPIAAAPAEPALHVTGRRLETARTHWQYGVWEEVATLDEAEIAADPDRAKLMALVAGAQASLGQTADARAAAHQAMDWGCDRSILSRILISAVHNSLAVAALGLEETDTARHHFRKAIAHVEPRADADLLARTREIRQAARAGLLPDAVTALDDTLKRVQASPDEVSASLGMLREEMALVRHELVLSLKRRQIYRAEPGTRAPAGRHADVETRAVFKAHPGLGPATARTARFAHDGDSAPFVVVAGMRHSGSTALFNIVRLGLAANGMEPLAGYSEFEGFVQKARHSRSPTIIKTHEFRDDVLEIASIVLTTKRDLRDTVASGARRKFYLLREHETPANYAKYNRMLHDAWAPHSHYEFSYERYRNSPLDVAREVFNLLGLDESRVEEIVQDVETLPVDQYKTTLLSPTHITDPERRLTYSDTLKPEDVKQIERQNGRWLVRNGYALTE